MSTGTGTGTGLPASGGSRTSRQALGILVLVIALIAIVILFSQCGGCDKINGLFKGDGKIDQILVRLDKMDKRMDEFGAQLQDGCTHCWTEQQIRDLVCDQLKKGCNKPKPQPRRTTCGCGGNGWECVDIREYQCAEVKNGLCPGPWYMKCARGCRRCNDCEPVTRRDYTPPPERQRDGDYETITIRSQKGIEEVYTDLLDAPGVEPITPGRREGRRFYPSDPNTHEVKFRVPKGTKLPHYNVKAPDDEWSADHTRAKVRNDEEETDPNYRTSWQRNDGPENPSDTDDTTKANGDWSYNAEDPEAIQSDDNNGVWDVRETH